MNLATGCWRLASGDWRKETGEWVATSGLQLASSNPSNLNGAVFLLYFYIFLFISMIIS